MATTKKAKIGRYNKEDQEIDTGRWATKYTYEEKWNVCNHYVIRGNSSGEAAKLTGIKAVTIRAWTQTQWWQEMVADVRKRHADRFDGKFTAIIDKIYKEVADRVAEGDEVLWAKTGEMLRKKMSGKDLTLMLAVMIEKRALLRGDPTTRTEKTTIAKQMKTIQEQLEERTRDNRKKIAEADNVEDIQDSKKA